MTVDLDSGNGLFDRLGKLIKLIEQVNTNIGGAAAADIPVLTNDLSDKFGTGSSNNELVAIEGLQTGLIDHQAAAGGYKETLRDIATEILLTMVHDDNPLPDRDVDNAMLELIRQMDTGSETVNASAVGSSIVYDGSNDGDGIVLVTEKDEKGRDLERLVAEDIRIRFTSPTACSIDAQESSEDTLDHDFPTGSGTSATYNTLDASTAGTLSNQGFEDWSGTIPDNWTVASGPVVKEVTQIRSGTASCEITNATTPTLTQSILGITGRKSYVLHIAVKAEAALTTGNITIAIKDAGGVITDEEGNNLSYSISQSSIVHTAWTSFVFAVHLPDPLSATQLDFEIDIDTTFDQLIYLDDVIFGQEVNYLGDGAPGVDVIDGPNAWGTDDKIDVTTTNTLGEFQSWFNRLFDTTLLLPSNSAGGETILDSLIG